MSFNEMFEKKKTVQQLDSEMAVMKKEIEYYKLLKQRNEAKKESRVE